MPLLRAFFYGLFIIFLTSAGWAGQITPDAASRVAEGQVRHHIAVFGDWNGSTAPTVSAPEVLSLDKDRRAYHFPVSPTGYVIVSAHDLLSPVPFYSTRSAFVMERAVEPRTFEAFVVSRLDAKAEAAEKYRIRKAASAAASELTASIGNSYRVGNAWTYFGALGNGETGQELSRHISRSADDAAGSIIRGEFVAPLLSTVWGQASPYNVEMPDAGCNNNGGLALTGCVATAWAQVLKYWQWPPQSLAGQGSHTYVWKSGGDTSFSVDFTNPEAYDWANMPNDLTADNISQDQITAVSKLMYYLAVSADMEFGCDENGGSGSERWADQVLDEHFRYKPLNESQNRRERKNYSASQWLAIIKRELTADPPRPIIFSMGSQKGWHEVVIDGYQSGVADKVHVNFGWNGDLDAYFDITDDDDFNTGDFDWTVDDNQVIVVGIEPEKTPSTPSDGGGGGGGGGSGCFLDALRY